MPCCATGFPTWWGAGPASRWRWIGPALMPMARRRSCCRCYAAMAGRRRWCGAVETATLKARRNDYEYQVLVRLAEALPAEVRVRIVADRGFGDQKLYRVLTEELKFDFVIRFRGNIMVTAADGEARAAADWVGVGGRARVLRGATVTAAGYEVGAVVCVQAKGMK